MLINQFDFVRMTIKVITIGSHQHNNYNLYLLRNRKTVCNKKNKNLLQMENYTGEIKNTKNSYKFT